MKRVDISIVILHRFRLHRAKLNLKVTKQQASKSVCSLREAMAGSLSVGITAVSSAKVADVVSCETGRSGVNSR
jgi:hypothetical protein